MCVGCEDVESGPWTLAGQVSYEHDAHVEIYARPGEDGVDLAVVITRTGDFEVTVAIGRYATSTRGGAGLPPTDQREAQYEAVRRVTYTDPAAAAVGATEAPFSALQTTP